MACFTTFNITRSHISRVNWKAVLFFYISACGLSYGLHFLPNLNKGILPSHNVFTYGLGPLLAAMLTRLIFRNQGQTITVFGPARLKAIAFVLTPILLSTAIGVPRAGQNEHVYGLLLGLSGVLYAFGEEMGWRGYLSDALRPLPTFWRILLVAGLWFGWHFTFLPDLSAVVGPDSPAFAVFLVFVLASWGLDTLINQTKSVLTIACTHELMNIAIHPVTLLLTLVVWVWLVRTWRKPVVQGGTREGSRLLT